MSLRNVILNSLFLLASTGLSGIVSAAGDFLLPPGYITRSTIDGNVAEPDKKSNSGVVTVNVASGEQNTQANSGSFALNLEDGAAKTNTVIQQAINSSQLTPPNVAEAQIIGNSFNNTVGWVAINQASGQANAQINAFAFGEGNHATMVATGLTQTVTGHFETPANTPNYFGNPDDYFGNPDDYFGNPDDYFVNQDGAVGTEKVSTELGINGELLADNALQETLSGEQSPVNGGPSLVQRAISVEDTAFKGARGLVQLNQSAGSGNSSINNFALRVTVDAKL